MSAESYPQITQITPIWIRHIGCFDVQFEKSVTVVAAEREISEICVICGFLSCGRFVAVERI